MCLRGSRVFCSIPVWGATLDGFSAANLTVLSDFGLSAVISQEITPVTHETRAKYGARGNEQPASLALRRPESPRR
jgi:hypothetical protein